MDVAPIAEDNGLDCQQKFSRTRIERRMIDQAAALSADRHYGEGSAGDSQVLAGRVARLDVHEDPAAAACAWAELEAVAPASVYQTRKWLLPWLETVGRAHGVAPMIVVARGAQDAPLALFPFGLVEQGSLRVVHFLGGRDSNSNLGLIRPGIAFEPADIVALLRAAAQATRLKPDAFVLLNQPTRWEGGANPLALLPHQPSPSECHSASLIPGAADFVAERLSTDARKKLRKKRRKLADFGAVAHVVARSAGDVACILDVFFAQKLERFRQKKISSDFEAPEARQFLTRACLDGLDAGTPSIELHALTAGERIVAVYAGAPHRRRFHAMVNSFDPDPDIARTSPGDLLLMSMMQMMCERGLDTFDLGIGEARYKSAWCDQTEPLVDTFYGVTLKGRAYVLGESARLRVKRAIKQNKWLWTTVQRLRAKIG